MLLTSAAAQEEWGQREHHKHKDIKSQIISLGFFFFNKKDRFSSTDLKSNVLLMGKGNATAGALTAR